MGYPKQKTFKPNKLGNNYKLYVCPPWDPKIALETGIGLRLTPFTPFTKVASNKHQLSVKPPEDQI